MMSHNLGEYFQLHDNKNHLFMNSRFHNTFMDGLCVSHVGYVTFYLVPPMSNKIFYSILLGYTFNVNVS